MKTLCCLMGIALLCGCGGRVIRDPPRLAQRKGIDPTLAPPQPVIPVVDPGPAPLASESHEELGATTIPTKRDKDATILFANGELRDAYFEYDRAELRSGSYEILKSDADLLIPIFQEFPAITLIVEGHCDERGSAEYNIGLGDHRAANAVDILVAFGLPAARIQHISYGKEQPQCIESNEGCWQRNRRAHLVVR